MIIGEKNLIIGKINSIISDRFQHKTKICESAVKRTFLSIFAP